MSTIQRNHHVLAVPDLDRSAAWFERVLGCTRSDPDPGSWAFLERDAVVFMLGRCPDAVPPAELGDHGYFAYLVVDDLTELEGRADDDDVLQAATARPWGMTELVLRTVDGHRLVVACPTPGM